MDLVIVVSNAGRCRSRETYLMVPGVLCTNKTRVLGKEFSDDGETLVWTINTKEWAWMWPMLGALTAAETLPNGVACVWLRADALVEKLNLCAKDVLDTPVTTSSLFACVRELATTERTPRDLASVFITSQLFVEWNTLARKIEAEVDKNVFYRQPAVWPQRISLANAQWMWGTDLWDKWIQASRNSIKTAALLRVLSTRLGIFAVLSGVDTPELLLIEPLKRWLWSRGLRARDPFLRHIAHFYRMLFDVHACADLSSDLLMPYLLPHFKQRGRFWYQLLLSLEPVLKLGVVVGGATAACLLRAMIGGFGRRGITWCDELLLFTPKRTLIQPCVRRLGPGQVRRSHGIPSGHLCDYFNATSFTLQSESPRCRARIVWANPMRRWEPDRPTFLKGFEWMHQQCTFAWGDMYGFHMRSTLGAFMCAFSGRSERISLPPLPQAPLPVDTPSMLQHWKLCCVRPAIRLSMRANFMEMEHGYLGHQRKSTTIHIAGAYLKHRNQIAQAGEFKSIVDIAPDIVWWVVLVCPKGRSEDVCGKPATDAVDKEMVKLSADFMSESNKTNANANMALQAMCRVKKAPLPRAGIVHAAAQLAWFNTECRRGRQYVRRISWGNNSVQSQAV